MSKKANFRSAKCKNKSSGKLAERSLHLPIVSIDPYIHNTLPPLCKTSRAYVQKGQSCASRFCTRICNFFNRVNKSAEDEHGLYNQRCQSQAAVCFRNRTPLKHLEGISSLGLFPIEDNVVTQLPNVNYSATTTASDTEDGEYIIYIPRVSRTKLEKSYLEPLRKDSLSPIVIQPNFKKSSCTLVTENIGCNNERASGEETFVNYLARVGKLINETAKAYEDYKGQNEKKGAEITPRRNTTYFYIPISNSKESWFQVRDKTLTLTANSCPLFNRRQAKAARNRQRLRQETMDKWQMYFTTWSRRRLIAEMKKRLASDNSPMCSPPPDTLESRFHHIHWLGKSGKSNNSVGRYFDKEENIIVAVKIFSDKPFDTTVENLDNKLLAIQEITALRKLHQNNIVRLFGYFELHDKYHIILESCDHSLREDIEEASSGLGATASKKIIKQILCGLHYCHQMNCLHRDLCPENILVCKSGLVKIADFDRSVIISDAGVGTTSPTPGMFIYSSPEILAGDLRYGLPSDVWSIGIIFYELLTGQPPWHGRNAQSQLRDIHNCVGPLLPRHASIAKLQVGEKPYSLRNHAQLQQMLTTLPGPCCSFIKKCLDVNPQSRFTCGELLQHHFIKSN